MSKAAPVVFAPAMAVPSSRPEWRPPRLGGALLWGALIALVLLVAYLAVMPAARRSAHSPYNHFALQAEAWLEGRLDLGGPPPRYTGFDDFAVRDDRYFVSFPPVPSLLLLPFVAVAGAPERVLDPLLFASLAPLGPALFFLALEALRRAGRSRRSERENVGLALLLGLGTVYWFSAVQGSVWFAAHVVTMVLGCGYLLASVEARHPLLAGLLLALAVGTRPSLAFAAPVFLHEAFYAPGSGTSSPRSPPRRREQLRRMALFASPLLVVGAALAAYNAARFGDPLEFGHRFLAIKWRDRIDAHGLFDLSYLAKNLTVVLGGVPFRHPDAGWQINAHGLALWLTTPGLVWALLPPAPRRQAEQAEAPPDRLLLASGVSALLVALPSLLYQNTGWIQFGQRFSNDYVPLLLLVVALNGRRLGRLFWGLALVAVVVNGIGAVTFGNPRGRGLYFVDPTQRILIWPGGPTSG